MSSILFFHIMRGNLFHHVSCVFPWNTPMFSMLRAQRAMLLRRCFRWCSRWAWHQAMWTHPKKELGVCGGQVDLACIHQVDPSCGIPYHTQDLVTSEIVETSAASNNCFRKPALWCFMITIPYVGRWVTDLSEKTWSPGAVEAQQDAQLTKLSCRRWSE